MAPSRPHVDGGSAAKGTRDGKKAPISELEIRRRQVHERARQEVRFAT